LQNNSINILHILPSPNLGGVQTNLLLKSKYDKNYNINRQVIFTVSSKGELLGQSNQLFEKHIYCPILPPDLGYRPYRLYKIYRKWLSLFFVFRLYTVLKNNEAKIIHSDDSLKLVSQIIASLLAKKKFIWHLHTSDKVIKSWLLNSLLYLLVKKNIITMNSVSKAALKSNFSNYNKILQKVNFIQAGIEPSTFINNNYRKSDVRAEYGFQKDDLLIGSTGRLHWAKGYEVLIKSVNSLIVDHGIAIKLVIAGEGYLRAKLSQIIHELDLVDHVILLGSVQNIAKFLSMLDLYTQPSLSEGFPVAVIEAMVSRVPVVCSNAGGLPELVKKNKTGFVVNKNEIKSLTEGFIKLLNSDKKEIKKMVDSGFQLACQFSIDEAINKDLTVYRSLLN
jgi:glycosyltransferase involved in cell wall biosynthesis